MSSYSSLLSLGTKGEGSKNIEGWFYSLIIRLGFSALNLEIILEPKFLNESQSRENTDLAGGAIAKCLVDLMLGSAKECLPKLSLD